MAVLDHVEVTQDAADGRTTPAAVTASGQPAAAETAPNAAFAAAVSDAFAVYADRLAAFESGERWRGRDIAIKRILDCVLCVPFLALSIPLMVLAGIWVKLVSSGPALYSQERIGARGERFRVLKLRTMYCDADARLRDHLDRDPAARAEWDQYVKLKNDPRLLPVVGRFLRKTSIDELPQLWNVLRGDMSLVGPRPFSDNDLPHYDRVFLAHRETMRPGITGLWQIFARGGDVRTKEVLDTFYLRNWSLRLDMLILLRTPLALLGTRGAS